MDSQLCISQMNGLMDLQLSISRIRISKLCTVLCLHVIVVLELYNASFIPSSYAVVIALWDCMVCGYVKRRLVPKHIASLYHRYAVVIALWDCMACDFVKRRLVPIHVASLNHRHVYFLQDCAF